MRLSVAWPLSLALVLVAGCHDADETMRAAAERARQPLLIAVVGDGVGADDATAVGARRAAYSPNRSQGKAMWDGANAAYEHERGAVDKSVHLQRFDDGGNPDDAQGIAQTIRRDPHYLAVIGHATSGTSAAAGPVYAEGGLPLLMPIATAPSAIMRPGTTKARLPNVFRLPPNDEVQARAIASVAAALASNRKAFVVADYTTPNNREYSSFLFNRVRELLGPIVARFAVIEPGAATAGEVAAQIHNEAVDVVVFAGYGTVARDLLTAMNAVWSTTDPRPSVLLTDGARIPDLNPGGFDVQLTFPSPPPTQCTAADPDQRAALVQSVKNGADMSYQTYGYDAMLLALRAVEHCSDSRVRDLSRRCVQEFLERVTEFHAGCHTYTFRSGENDLARSYYLYRVLGAETKESQGTGPARYEYVREISFEQLSRVFR